MGFVQAVMRMKQAGMAPTRKRMALAAVALAGTTVPTTAEELRDQALDAGLCLTEEAAEEALAELRGAGLLPEVQAPPARLLAAMGNPHRYAVLRELTSGERCVGALQRAVGIQQSSLSQHLARLRADGLVATRRDAARIFYTLADPRVEAVLRQF